jgi:uncharacterized membrane protein YhaH (DUF805 family)
MSTQPSQTQLEVPALSFFERLVGIHIHPRRTFKDIVRKPDFVLPVITVVLMNLLVLWAAIARVGVERLHDLYISWGDPAYSFSDHLPLFDKFTVAQLHLFAILSPFSAVIYLAGGTVVIQDAIFRTKASPKTLGGIAAYAYLVKLLGGLIGLAVIFLANPDGFNPLIPAPTNIGISQTPRKRRNY